MWLRRTKFSNTDFSDKTMGHQQGMALALFKTYLVCMAWPGGEKQRAFRNLIGKSKLEIVRTLLGIGWQKKRENRTLERPVMLYSGPIHREPCHSTEPCFPVTSFNSVKLLVHIKGLLFILKALHTLKHSLIWKIMLPSYMWFVQICLQTFNTAEHTGSWVFSLNSTTIACIPSASIDWSDTIPSCRPLKGSGNRNSSAPATGKFKVGSGGSYNI